MSGRGGCSSAEVTKLQGLLGGLVEVRPPEAAEEPILAPMARAAAFEWLAELRAEDDLRAAGITPRRTALLTGPPGTGKTTLAHHLAARLGWPLVLVGAEAIFSKYVGEAEQKTAALFRVLNRDDTPRCILFLDEIEAIGRKRDMAGDGAAAQSNIAVLTIILRRIESFRGMMLAATNRPDDLDPALWRRFGMQLVVDLPGPDERYAILARYALPWRLRPEDLDLLTDLTDGASPALLRGLMEGAKRAMVLWPRMGRDPGEARAVFGTIVAGLRPPPEIQPPPLWASPAVLGELAEMQWPPARETQGTEAWPA